MGEEQKKLLEQQLWNIANTLRGKMDADEFRDYILGFIFYKYLSEKIEDYADDILKEDEIRYLSLDEASSEGQEYLEAIREEAIEKLGYFLKPSELFSQVAKRGNGDKNNFILEDLTKILRSIESSTMGHESEDDFVHLFEDLDLTSTKLGKTEEAKNTLIAKVLFHLDQINFELKNHDRDVLGDAYEYLIAQFAAGAGKKAGEFYTPQQVSKILAKIVTNGKTKLKSVYDPTCGSGSLLLRVAKEVQDVSNFYGQELNRTTYNLARMNMIMHDVHYRKFDIKQEDTLEHPQHIDHRFEAIVANPPFSANWSANPLHMSDDRFSQYGVLAPSSKADFAFVQHMIHHLDENGTMAIVLPHGVLFRGSSEGVIRKYLIENKNYLDAVIGLPANVFYGTSIPTCILVFKKCREDSEHVLFIDASNEFEKVKNQNLLTDENVEKIINTYKNRTEIEKYSHLAPLSEIAENDYNLNIPRYVDTFEEEEAIDLDATVQKLQELEFLSVENDKIIDYFCNLLQIQKPIGNNLPLLQQYKKGVMQKIFSQGLRFIADDGSEFPEWEEKKLGEIADIIGGGTPETSKEEYWNGSIQWFTPTEIKSDYVSKSLRTISELGLKKSSAKLLPIGAILLTTRATIGEVAITLNECTTNQGFQSLVVKENVNNVFIFNWIKKNKHEFVKKANGSTFSEISKSEIEQIDIQLPSLVEQTKIANFLSAIDTKINFVIQQLNEAKNFNKVLLQQILL